MYDNQLLRINVSITKVTKIIRIKTKSDYSFSILK